MDEEEFRVFMKKKGKSKNTVDNCVSAAKEFETYFEKKGLSLDKVTTQDLETFISEYLEKKRTAKFLWSINYYFLFLERNDLLDVAHGVRAQLIKKKRKSFKLKDFMGVEPEHASSLTSVNVNDEKEMLEVGKTPKLRRELANKTKLDIKVIEEIVKLSDLARIPGVKGIRARLYYDAGFDLLDKLRKVTPEKLLQITREFVETTRFDGIAPLPKEAHHAIETAKKLPDVVKW